jgi:prepilin-type processing-associated H-X9-DG protein
VIAMIGIVIGFLMPLIRVARQSSRSTACLMQLKGWNESFQSHFADRRARGQPFGPITTPAHANAPTAWWDALRPGQPPLCPEPTDSTWDAPDRPRGEVVGSLGLNAWLYAPDPLTPGAAVQAPAGEPANVPVVFDCARWEIFPRDTDPPKLFRAGATGEDGWMQMAALERHKRSTHVAFLDGHARAVAPAELWRMKWHTDFKPREVTIAE